jgi:stearoyl-CoA desaturase (delta-9 desaturase)
LTALLWAGGVRIFFLHHVTWSVNSLCHTSDAGRSTPRTAAPTCAAAILTMGESWHNGHHAFPRSARHGLLAGQWDSSALLIRGFEGVGWARDVHQPKPEAIRRKLREASQDGEVREPQ